MWLSPVSRVLLKPDAKTIKSKDVRENVNLSAEKFFDLMLEAKHLEDNK